MKYPIYRFRFTLEPQETMRLQWPGTSVLRGAFGSVFRELVCVCGLDDCDKCTERQCAFREIFMPGQPQESDMKRMKDPPRPYVFQMAEPNLEVFDERHPLKFHLILFGKAVDYAVHFIHVFERLAHLGLGRERARYRLRDVEFMDEIEGARSVYVSEGLLANLDFPRMTIEAPKEERLILKINFVSPTRLSKQLDSELFTMPKIIAMIASRYNALALFYSRGTAELPWRELREMAEEAHLISRNLYVYGKKRHSTRTGRDMHLTGFHGSISFSNVRRELAPVLRIGERIHIGKWAAFGFGSCIVDYYGG